jgi:hypothetical protein
VLLDPLLSRPGFANNRFSFSHSHLSPLLSSLTIQPITSHLVWVVPPPPRPSGLSNTHHSICVTPLLFSRHLYVSPYPCPRHWFRQPIKPRRIQTLPPPLTSGEENWTLSPLPLHSALLGFKNIISYYSNTGFPAGMHEQWRSLPKPVYVSAKVVVAVWSNAPTNVVRGNEQKTVVVC